jgi:hypothetical protein
MDPQTHPDPFRDAARQAMQRFIQITSSAATGAQVLIHLRTAHAKVAAEQDEQERRALLAQTQAELAEARASWAPGLDPDWLRQADLLQTARVWGAAAPYGNLADAWCDPSAVTALSRCGERLRQLHPYAMRQYDRFRGQGFPPIDAMQEAAPFFTYAPEPRDGSYRPRPALTDGAAEARNQTGGLAARPVRQPWQQDFPLDIREVVARSPGAPASQRSNSGSAPVPDRRQAQPSGPRP